MRKVGVGQYIVLRLILPTDFPESSLAEIRTLFLKFMLDINRILGIPSASCRPLLPLTIYFGTML